jgi:hypothetical protein
MKLEAYPIGDSGGMAQFQTQLVTLRFSWKNSQKEIRNDNKCGVKSVGLKSITRISAQHSCNIWKLVHRIHYQEDDILRYVRNGDIIQHSFHYCKSIRVNQGTCFTIFSS